jgi:hypothetical protein
MNNRDLLLTALKAGTPRSRWQQILYLERDLSSSSVFLLCPYMGVYDSHLHTHLMITLIRD